MTTTSAAAPDKDPTSGNYTFTKEYFIELAAYINWADDIAMDWLRQINDEQWNKAAISSFGSIKETALHMVSAKKIWIELWTNVPTKVYLSKVFNGSRSELLTIWRKTSADLKDFIESFPVEGYLDDVEVIKPNGEVCTMEFRKTFPHMVNHSTYHRGQLVTLLRQAGFSNLSNADLFTYYNEMKQK